MNLNRENNVMPNAIPNQRPNIIPNVLPNRSFNIRYSNNNSNMPQEQQPSQNRMSGGSQNNINIYSDNEIQIPTSFDIVIDLIMKKFLVMLNKKNYLVIIKYLEVGQKRVILY